MYFATAGTNDFRQTALDGHVNIFQRIGQRIIRLGEFALHLFERRNDLAALVLIENAYVLQAARVGDIPLYISAEQTTVKANGSVKALHKRIVAIGETPSPGLVDVFRTH